VNVSVKGTGGLAAPIKLPDIHLTNLGQGPEGITARELTKKVLSEITSAVAQRAGNVIAEGAVDSATKAATKAGIDTVERAITKGVDHLFQKDERVIPPQGALRAARLHCLARYQDFTRAAARESRVPPSPALSSGLNAIDVIRPQSKESIAESASANYGRSFFWR
jgi:hypothetical protein